jgi:hypothetical protein
VLKITKLDKDKFLAVGSSYFRAANAGVLAMLLAGITDPKILVNGFLAGFIGPILKAVDPKAVEFGITSKCSCEKC